MQLVMEQAVSLVNCILYTSQ